MPATDLPEQRELVDHVASLLGKNRSDFMLEAAYESGAGGYALPGSSVPRLMISI